MTRRRELPISNVEGEKLELVMFSRYLKKPIHLKFVMLLFRLKKTKYQIEQLPLEAANVKNRNLELRN